MAFRREEAIGVQATSLYYWVDEQRLQQFKAMLSTQGAVYDFEARFRTRSGLIQTHIISAIIIDINGEPCILDTGRNITALKDLEINLRESEQKFSKLFRNSPVSMILTTFDDHRIVDVNETFIKDSGYSRNEVMARLLMKFRHGPMKKKPLTLSKRFSLRDMLETLKPICRGKMVRRSLVCCLPKSSS